jgi:DNA-binding transcriptional LysR family regulator
VLDLRRLQVLKAVVDSGSVTAAAQRLNYSASAVSQQLATLEREAGAKLLERSGRGVRPTSAGLLLAEHAGDVLSRMEEAERALHALRAGESGRLGIAAFPTAGAGLVPVAVGEFRWRCPGVELDLTIAEAPEATESVTNGQVDVAVVIGPPPDSLPSDGLKRLHLLDDPYRVVLPRRHRLAGRRIIDLAALAEEPWIATACGPACQEQVVAACKVAGFSPRFAVEADDYPATQGYVSAGLGAALVPMLALGAVRDGVVVRQVRGKETVRHIYALTRTSSDGPLAVMLEALKAAASEQRRTVAGGHLAKGSSYR